MSEDWEVNDEGWGVSDEGVSDEGWEMSGEWWVMRGWVMRGEGWGVCDEGWIVREWSAMKDDSMSGVGWELWGVGSECWGGGSRGCGWVELRVCTVRVWDKEQRSEIGPSPYRSNVKCLTYVVNILKLPVVSYSFELQKVRKTKLSLPQMKNYQNPFEQ